jgi:hypothetical protein
LPRITNVNAAAQGSFDILGGIMYILVYAIYYVAYWLETDLFIALFSNQGYTSVTSSGAFAFANYAKKQKLEESALTTYSLGTKTMPKIPRTPRKEEGFPSLGRPIFRHEPIRSEQP